jgi:2-hydroxymethylglutarate dehydrogenase
LNAAAGTVALEPVRIGFVGVGHMGNPMAANLLAAGHSLTVCDLVASAAASLVDEGAAWADSPAEVARASEVVFLSLPTPADVELVVSGDDGVLVGASPGAVLVDLSTNSPAVVRSLAEIAAASNVAFLDAPVSGGVGGARRATLAVMVGGEAEVFERVRPLFEVIGANVFHVGVVGSGNVAKLINNALFFIGMLGTAEALVLGTKAGVDPLVLRDIVKAGSGGSFAWDVGTRAILRDRLGLAFPTSLAAKDIGLAVALAEEFDVPSPMAALARQLIDGYCDQGLGGEDLMATVKVLEERAGVVVRGREQPQPSPADGSSGRPSDQRRSASKG